MKLGAFSVSLAVKDIKTSKAFYEKLGFKEFGGDLEQGYLMLKNGQTVIGLFQGMFEGNILTFNPGWDQEAKEVKDYDDVRKIQESLESDGVELIQKVDKDNPKGPGSITLKDPDGNSILIDQFVG
jgi:catechol 2,3-dioxygenase-like lactoylglutathione lyase family enzyme